MLLCFEEVKVCPAVGNCVFGVNGLMREPSRWGIRAQSADSGVRVVPVRPSQLVRK